MKKAAHSLLFAVIVFVVLLPVLASRHEPIDERGAFQIRGLLAPESSSVAGASTAPAAATSTPAETSAATTSAAASTVAPSSAAAATSANPSSEASASTTHATSQAASSSQPATAVSSAVPTTATDSLGQVITSLVPETLTSSSATPSQTNSNNSSNDLSTGSIIGLSVAGGVAALGIVLFFVWKFTRKQFSDFDDNEAIKWPELNAHSNDVHALPTNATGRAGFGPENDSDINLTRAPSPGGTYTNSIAASSVPEVYGGGDPYAVPPLPHLNPNQPYHDEPSAYGQPTAYYDPYHGPVPNTFTDTISDGHGAESIPMTQMARVRSPGPQMAYNIQRPSSPVPQAAMGYTGIDERSRTPNPSALGSHS